MRRGTKRAVLTGGGLIAMRPAMRRDVVLILVCGAVVVSLSRAIRQVFGLFLPPIVADLGIGRETFSFAMAIQQALLGVFQPLTAMLADHYGTGRMLAVGGAAYALGLFIMAGATTPLGLDIGGGLFVGFGSAATGYAVVLGAIGRRVRPERRGRALGLTAAGGSVGQVILPPVCQYLIAALGWADALLVLAALAATMIVFALALTGRAADAPVETAGTLALSLGEAIAEAARHRGFRYLTAGFFVCGFQVTFVAIHFPAYLADIGMTAGLGASALALIGLFNILGTYLFGHLGDRYPKKYLLSGLYFLRALTFGAFLLLPKSTISVMIFAAVLGVLWLGTVPLTSGLVAHIFGARYMASLFGFVFFSHQVGGFLGAWLGGYLFDATGSYDLVWAATVVLGVAAGLLHLPIADRPLRVPT